MKKFTTYMVGPLTFIESDKVETVIVKMGNEVSEMSKDECRELYSLAYDIKFTSPPKQPIEVPPEPPESACAMPTPKGPAFITLREGEF